MSTIYNDIPEGFEIEKPNNTYNDIPKGFEIENEPSLQTTQQSVVQQPPIQNQTVQNNDGSYTLSTGIQKRTPMGRVKNIANKAFNTAFPLVGAIRNAGAIANGVKTAYNDVIKPTYEKATQGLWHLGGKGLRAVLPKKAALPFLSEDWWFGTDEQHDRLNQLDDIAEQSGYYDQNAVRNDFLKGKLSKKQTNAYAQLVGERERLLSDLNQINTRAGNTAEGIIDIGVAAVPGGEFKGAGGIIGKGIYNLTRGANASKKLSLGTSKVGRYLTKHTLRGGQIGAEMAVLKNLYENAAGIEHDPFAKELVENIGFGIAADNVLPIGFKALGGAGKLIGKGVNAGANSWEKAANKLSNSDQNAVAWIGNRMNDIGNAATEAGALTKRFFTSDLNKVNIFGDKVNNRAKFNDKIAQLTNEDSFKSSIDPQIIKELEELPEEYTDIVYEALYKGRDINGNPLEPSEAYKEIMNLINAERIKNGHKPYEYSNGWKDPEFNPENIEQNKIIGETDFGTIRENDINEVDAVIQAWRESGYDDAQIAELLEQFGYSSKKPIDNTQYKEFVRPEEIPDTEIPNTEVIKDDADVLAGKINTPKEEPMQMQGATVDRNDTEALVGKINELNSKKTNTGRPEYDKWIAKNKERYTAEKGSPVKNETGINTHEPIETPQNEQSISTQNESLDDVLYGQLREPKPSSYLPKETSTQIDNQYTVKENTQIRKQTNKIKQKNNEVSYNEKNEIPAEVQHLESGMAEGADTLQRNVGTRNKQNIEINDNIGENGYGKVYDKYSEELKTDEIPATHEYKSEDVDFNKFYKKYSSQNFNNRIERIKAINDEIKRQGGDRNAFNNVYKMFMEQSERSSNLNKPRKIGDADYNDTWTELFMNDMKLLSNNYKNKPSYKLPDVGETTKAEIRKTKKLWSNIFSDSKNEGTIKLAKVLAKGKNPELTIYSLLNRKNEKAAQDIYNTIVKTLENSNISSRYRDIMINQLDKAADKSNAVNKIDIKKRNIKSVSIDEAADYILDEASRKGHYEAGKLINENRKTLEYAGKYKGNNVVNEHYTKSTEKAIKNIQNLTNKKEVINKAITEAKIKLKGKYLQQRLEYIDKHQDEIFKDSIKQAEKILEHNRNIIKNTYTDFEANEMYNLIEKHDSQGKRYWASEGTGDTWSSTTKNVSDKYKEANKVLTDLEIRIQNAKRSLGKEAFPEQHFNTPETGVEYSNWKPVTKSELTSSNKPLSNEMQQGALHEEEVKLNNKKAALDKEYSKTYADYQKEFGKKAYSKWIKRRQEIRNESKQIENRLEEISKERKEIQQKINAEPSDGGVSEENIKEVIQNKENSQIAEQPKNTTDVKYTEITNKEGQKIGVHDSGNLDVYYPNGFIKKRVNIKESPSAKRYLEDKQTDIFSDDFDASKTNFGKADRSVGSSHKFTDYAEEISNGDSEITKAIKETLGDEGFSFEEMSGGGRNYADGRVTINSKNSVVSQLKSLMHETHHKIAKAIAEMCGKDSVEYKIFQKGEEINNKIHDFESTNPGIVNTYNKIKSLRADDNFDGVREVYKDLSNTAKKYLSDYEDMIDEYYGSIIETEANLAKTGKWQFFGKDLKHYAQRLKEFNNRRLKGNKSQIEGNNNRATTGRPRTDGSMEDKGQLSGRLGNTSDRQYLEDKGVGLKSIKEQAKEFDFKRAVHDKKYADNFIKDLKKSVNNTENIVKKRLLATDPEILGRLELTGAETYLAPTKYKLNVDKIKLSKSTIKEGIKTFFDDWFKGLSDITPSYKVKEVFGHKSSSLEKKRSLQQQYVNTKMREAKIQSINNVMNEVESMPQTKPIIDGKIEKGYIPIKQGIMSNVLATGRGKDFYHLLESGDRQKIMDAFLADRGIFKRGYLKTLENGEKVLNTDNQEAVQAYKAAKHFADIAEREKEASYQVPKYVFDTLCSMNGEKFKNAFMQYGITSGTIGRLGATIADVPVALVKRAFLGLSTGWNIGNRLNNPILLGMQEKDAKSLAKHYIQAFGLKQKDLPPEMFDNNLLETSKLRETMNNVTGDEKTDAVIGLLSGNSVPKQASEHFLRKIGRYATLGVRIPTKIGEANMKLNEIFENLERKVAYAKQLDDLANKQLVKNVSNNIIRQGMSLPEINNIVMKDAKLRKYVLDRVYDTLGDFQALTPIEKGMCKRVAIFYSWLRTINRSLYKVASENPTKALMAYKTIQDIKEDDVNHKDFQKGAFPFELSLTRDGGRVLFNPMRYLNYYDTHEEATTRPGSTLNPYITLARESATGKSSFDGKNYKSKKYAQSSYYDKNQKRYIDGLWNTETQDWVRDKDGKISNSMPLDSRLRRFGVGSARLIFPSANASLINYEKVLDAHNTEKSDDTWKSEQGNRIEPDRLYDDDFGGYNDGDVYRTQVKKNGEVKVYDRYAATKFNRAGQAFKHILGGVFQEELPLNKEEKAKRDAKLNARKLEQENYDKHKRNKYKQEKAKKLAAWKAKHKKK